MNFRDLSPSDVHAELQAAPKGSLRLLDVRTHPEHTSHHLEHAQLVPIQELQLRLRELDPQNHYLVYCEHGMRSLAACEFLAEMGFAKITNVRGGMAAWIGAGLPYVRPTA